MQPTMMAKVKFPGSRRNGKCFSEAAGLVRLNIDGVVCSDKRLEGEAMAAFMSMMAASLFSGLF